MLVDSLADKVAEEKDGKLGYRLGKVKTSQWTKFWLTSKHSLRLKNLTKYSSSDKALVNAVSYHQAEVEGGSLKNDTQGV